MALTNINQRKSHAALSEIRYAHPDGDNASDGLTWSTAKKDLLGAYDALPAGGGEVHFVGSTYADFANQSRGLWIVGPDDPNYASPPTGWRQQKRLRLVGVGTDHVANGHAGQAWIFASNGTDRTKPTLWISGTNVPLTFENVMIAYPAVAIRLGMSSAGDNTTTNTAGIVFRNCGAQLNQIPGNGPTVELGYSYWIYWYDCVFGGCAPTQALTAASIVSGTTARFTVSGTHVYRVDDTVFVSGVTPAGYNGNWQITATTSTTFDADIGSSPGAGTIFGTVKPTRHYRRAAVAHDYEELSGSPIPSGGHRFENTNFNGGGIHYKPSGATSSGGMQVINATLEGDFGSDPMPPLLHVRKSVTANWVPDALSACILEEVGLADGNFVDGACLVDGFDYRGQDPVVGLYTDVHGYGIQIGGGTTDRNVTLLNRLGFHGRSDHASRTFGPTTIPFANLANQDPTTWTGGATITTGKAAPDGTTSAARLSSASGMQDRSVYSASRTVGVGDWIIAGVWRRMHSGFPSGDGDYPYISVGSGAAHFATGVGYFVLGNFRVGFDDGGWNWHAHGQKITQNPGSLTVAMSLRVDQSDEVDYAYPVLMHVPAASVVNENDVEEFIKVFQTFPDGAASTAGNVGLMRGQQLVFPPDVNLYRNAANVLATEDTLLLKRTAATGLVTTDGNELVLEETGDSIGTSRLRIQSRTGLTGALFESASVDVVDFGFKPQTASQALIRFEGRSPFRVTAAPEFQIGTTGGGGINNYPFVVSQGGRAIVTATATTVVPFTVLGLTSQSANLQEWRGSAAMENSSTLLTAVAADGKLVFGGDANLYREGADVLATDDKLHVVGETEIDGALNHDGTTVGFFGTAPATKPTALTAADSSTVDTTYGTEEANVIANLRTRVNELESKLQSLGLLS